MVSDEKVQAPGKVPEPKLFTTGAGAPNAYSDLIAADRRLLWRAAAFL